MDYPTEDEIQAMTNNEFATLIRSQAEKIELAMNRDDRPAPPSPTKGRGKLGK
jgi:hypothetical protein